MIQHISTRKLASDDHKLKKIKNYIQIEWLIF